MARWMTGLLTLAQAQERLLGAVAPLGAESLPASQAAGRYLVAPLIARRNQPAADLSAMDGYAVLADDAEGPWTIAGESAAGHPFTHRVAPGQAIRISTGALLPPGENLVLLQENTARDGDSVALNGQGVPEARHIRRAGFDFREGSELLPAGTRIGPAQLALALSAGHAELAVGRLPKVAILDSGDELSPDPRACAVHQIPASNGPMLAAMAAPLASAVDLLGPVPDRMDALAFALARANGADVVVTSGGVSVGDHDLIRPALKAWGASIEFWKVAIRPGKPLLVARRGQQWILGLPGNPVSSYVTAVLFLLPLLRALGGAGSASLLPPAVQAVLDDPLPETGDRQEFVRAFYRDGRVRPIGQQDSSALRALAGCNALIDREPGSPETATGQAVWLYPVGDWSIA